MASRYMLCSFKTCPWVQRAAIVLRAKQVPYDITYIDRDKRPDWFLAISPHSKVPVLKIDDEHALFESNAIAEYLEETAMPRLHPADPMARARNRAWTDYVSTFAAAVSATMYANSEAEFAANGAKLAVPFGKLDDALAQRGNNGPFFNGPNLSLVDAAYAPFLQRYTFMDHLHTVGVMDKFPRLAAWCHVLLDAPAVRASTVPNIEDVWQENLIIHKRWLAQFVSPSVIGAAAA